MPNSDVIRLLFGTPSHCLLAIFFVDVVRACVKMDYIDEILYIYLYGSDEAVL